MTTRRLRLAAARLRAAATLLLDASNLEPGTPATRLALGRAALDARDLADSLRGVGKAIDEYLTELRVLRPTPRRKGAA